MDKDRYYSILSDYVPDKALDYVVSLLQQYPLHLQITRERKTKHGDFKYGIGRQPAITINHNLNRYAFLITLLHELAHYKVYKTYGRRCQPHGKEWKKMFQDLMQPILEQQIFPETLHNVMVQHMKKPKASSNSDVNLVKALRQFDDATDVLTLDELAINDLFVLHGRTFKLGEKRRTRYQCTELNTNKKYLINQLAEVVKVC